MLFLSYTSFSFFFVSSILFPFFHMAALHRFTLLIKIENEIIYFLVHLRLFVLCFSKYMDFLGVRKLVS